MINRLPFHFVDVRVGSGRRQSFLAHVDGRPGVMAANILTAFSMLCYKAAETREPLFG
jgi:hypothetical protein